jgi:hypothetical protein
MSAYKRLPDGTTVKKRNKISEQFASHPISMLSSPAWRVLSLSARRVLDRIAIELAKHGGNDNGQLPVTFEHFEEYGIDRHAIGPAIREAATLGFIEVTQAGRAGNGETRKPNLFRITYVNSRGPEPTHEWRAIKTVEEAIALAMAARQSKQRQHRKQNPSGGKRHVSVGVSPTGNAKSPVGVSPTTAVADTPTTSRSRVRGERGRDAATAPSTPSTRTNGLGRRATGAAASEGLDELQLAVRAAGFQFPHHQQETNSCNGHHYPTEANASTPAARDS